MINWAMEHPFLVIIIVLVAENLVSKMIVRGCRCIQILIRGYPSNPVMDADGDIVYPDHGKKEEE